MIGYRATVSPAVGLFVAVLVVGLPLAALLGVWLLVIVAVLAVAALLDVARRRRTRRL